MHKCFGLSRRPPLDSEAAAGAQDSWLLSNTGLRKYSLKMMSLLTLFGGLKNVSKVF